VGVGDAPINYMGVASNYTNLITSDQSINLMLVIIDIYWNFQMIPSLTDF